MNFIDFWSIHHSETYFWKIALPVAFGVIGFLMRDMLLHEVGTQEKLEGEITAGSCGRVKKKKVIGG